MSKTIDFLPMNVPTVRARVLGKEDRELYKEVKAKAKEKFGEKSRAYQTTIYGIDTENVTGSQFFWNNEVELYLPKDQRIMNLEDLGGIYNKDSNFFSGHYADTTPLCLRTKTPSGENNKQILGYLERQLKGEKINGAPIEFDSENPILISGLEKIKDSNSNNFYGIKLKIGNDTKIVYNKDFASSKNKIKFGNVEKDLLTKKDGLSGVYAGDVLYVGSSDDYLRYSDGDGWVVVYMGVVKDKSKSL